MHQVPTHQAPLLKSRVLAGLCCVLLVFLLGPKPLHAQASFDCTQVTDVPVSECEALVALYNSTGGPNWDRSYNWLSSTQVGLWQGVHGIRGAHVSELSLRSNNLKGALPPEFGQLSNLQELLLFNNQLITLPPEFGQLSQLVLLGLGRNQLTTLPPEFGQLSSLRELELDDNQLTTLPPEFGQLSELEYLVLRNNQLSTLPPEFGQLSELEYLVLSNNQLSTLPPEIGQLSNMRSLFLSNNQLSTLPPEFGQLSELEHLELDDNQLSTLPPEIGQLSNMRSLFLDNNQFSGPIPAVLASLPTLIYLDLQNNDFCGPVPPFRSIRLLLDDNPRIGQPCDGDDTSPPVCGEITLEHNTDGELTAVTTTAQDPESGIASAHFSKLRNLHGFLNSLGPFAQDHTETFDPPTTMVTIRGERINMTTGGVIIVTLTNGAGLTRQCDPVLETLSAEVPEAFALAQNYPNPFNPETTIRFALPEASAVRLVVYDVLGREVAVLVDETLAAGTYEARWEGTNTTGAALAGGVYLYRITAGTFTDTRSMILQK